MELVADARTALRQEYNPRRLQAPSSPISGRVDGPARCRHCGHHAGQLRLRDGRVVLAAHHGHDGVLGTKLCLGSWRRSHAHPRHALGVTA
jgi:hypothetical protein